MNAVFVSSILEVRFILVDQAESIPPYVFTIHRGSVKSVIKLCKIQG